VTYILFREMAMNKDDLTKNYSYQLKPMSGMPQS